MCPKCKRFQSSLLRCSDCDLRWAGDVLFWWAEVSILFIEVFWLWLLARASSPPLRPGFQSSLLRCSDCDNFIHRPPLIPPWVSILFIEVFWLWHNFDPQSPLGISIVSILFIEVFWLWRRTLNPLISLVPYAIFRTPPQNWNFLGNIALVQKWPKCRFPLCDVAFRVSEHLPGLSRSSRCSENHFLIGNLQRPVKAF